MTGPRIGTRLGHYHLVRLLGSGGFADVYLGTHIHLQTLAAVKVLRHPLSGTEIARFRAEARTIARLAHPHIVRLLDFDVEQAVAYFVMDYAPGGTLRARHPAGTQLGISRLLSYVRQIAAAVQYAHDQRVIHRDIKPENLLLGGAGEVLLSDFGSALVASSSERITRETAGTVSYMAPEQLQGRPQRASDQYALGIIVFEWLCGERPFRGSWGEVAAQHLSTPPPRLSACVPTIAPELEEVVLTALAKDPGQRFASVWEFAAALELAADSTLRQGRSRDVSRRALLASGIGIAAGGGLVAGLAAALLQRYHPQAAGLLPSTHLRPAPTAPAPGRPLPASSTPALTPDPPTATPRAPGTTLSIYRGHTAVVTGVAWSPDGTRIASASSDGTVQVWLAATGERLLAYRGHTGPVNAVAWSPDGTRIASAGDDATVQVWSATTGKPVLTYRGHTMQVNAVTWSPDSTAIASGSLDQTVRAYNAATGSTVFTYSGHTAVVYAIAWAPDGSAIASGSGDQTVQVCNAVTGNTALSYFGHTALVTGVVWSPDSTAIASSSFDRTVRVCNAATGNTTLTNSEHASIVYCVGWSPDGARIASGSQDQTVQVWSATTGKPVLIYRRHANYVYCLAWSPESTRLASGGGDQTVQVWQVG